MQTSTTPPATDQSLDGLLPLSRAAAELHCSYFTVRDMALRGQLELCFRGHRLYVTAVSVAAFKAEA
jgi:hypothetical protein